MLYDGSIIGLSFRANTAKTAGTASFGAFIATAASGISVVWDTGKFRDFRTFAPGTFTFKAGDDVGPRLTTDSAFTPITVDVGVRLFVTFVSS